MTAISYTGLIKRCINLRKMRLAVSISFKKSSYNLSNPPELSKSDTSHNVDVIYFTKNKKPKPLTNTTIKIMVYRISALYKHRKGKSK